MALEAVKALPQDVRVGQVILLHGTVSPGYDLRPVVSRAEVLNVHSANDCLINGLGPLLFGTNDRVRAPACGMVGFRGEVPGLRQRPWCRADIRHGYFGDHFTVMSAAWIARNVAPLLRSGAARAEARGSLSASSRTIIQPL